MTVRRATAASRQYGFVLLFIVLVLIAVSGAVLFSGLTVSRATEVRLARNVSAEQRLSRARDALLGFAIGSMVDGRPGELPGPDHAGDNNYDGNANNASCLDGAVSSGMVKLASGSDAKSRCLGKLPWKTLGLSIDGADEFDLIGAVPWYAVSASLSATNICLTYLNPMTVAAAPVAFMCPSDNAPPFPWLKVCDETGRLLSDRVAFVLIEPGEPIATTGRVQARNGVPRPKPGDYLDAIPTPPGWSALAPGQRCNTYDNAALNNEFVTANRSPIFNDRVLFVTVDELMARVESRVAQEAREALIAFQAARARNTWMAPIGNPSSVTDAFIAVPGTLAGFMPFNSTTQKFKTEAAWSIGSPAASDLDNPDGNDNLPFLCFGGTYRCRLRASPGSLLINATVTKAQLPPYKNSAEAQPKITCSFSTTNKLDCDIYSVVVAQTPVTYDVCRHLLPAANTAGSNALCGGNGYTYFGTYTGTQTRTLSLLVSALTASGTASIGPDATFMIRRSLTRASTATAGMLSLVDTFTPSPAAAGIVPFDVTSSIQTGSTQTNGTGAVTISNIRVYPVMPSWYVSHKWHEFIYAAISPDASAATGAITCTVNCFSAGSRNGLYGVVISTGKPLTPQNRYAGSPAAIDFLEAPNLTGTTSRLFADSNTSQSPAYADTVVTLPR